MIIIIKNLSKGLIVLMLLFATSCSLSTNELSTDELTEEVKISMQETWKEEGVSGIKIESFGLTHTGGNEYWGTLETNEEGEKLSYEVNVAYDGESFTWEIVDWETE
ncbi:MAG: hypothetical protein FJX84_10245 [Bacteroidetes bacterium]|nr:hypothetical protein [Bacteroidota bacterium]